jgi:hypothetical protein
MAWELSLGPEFADDQAGPTVTAPAPAARPTKPSRPGRPTPGARTGPSPTWPPTPTRTPAPRGHRRARRTGVGLCRASRLFIQPAHCPFERKRSEQHHVTALALPNAVIAHRSLIHKARSAGHRDSLLIPRDDGQEDASCSQVEQPAGEQDRRSSRIAAPSRMWRDPVTELCYVLFGPVIDPAAASQFTRSLVQDCEHNPRRCPSRRKRTPVQRELIDDGLCVRGRGWRSRAPQPVVAAVIATDRRVGACFGHEPGVTSRPRPQGDQAVRERHDWTIARHVTILPPTSDSLR